MMEGSNSPDLNILLGWDNPYTSYPYKLTHRQVLTWIEYNKLAFNAPDRHDYYLMSISCQVARSSAKAPAAIQVSHFKLENNDVSQMSKEERNRLAIFHRQSRIAARGGIDRYTIMDAQGNVIRPALRATCVPAATSSGQPNPLIRPPSAEEIRQFAERLRANNIRARDARNSADGGCNGSNPSTNSS